MIKKLKLLILSFSSLFIFAAPLAMSATVSAGATGTGQTDINGGLNCGANGDFSNTSCDTTDASGKVNTTLQTAINVLSIAVGAIAVVMIIVGGLRYVTSGGKQESVTGAKNMILYAIIGLVIVALAQIIVHFVLQKTTSATS